MFDIHIKLLSILTPSAIYTIEYFNPLFISGLK
jgi:hypothetical protein